MDDTDPFYMMLLAAQDDSREEEETHHLAACGLAIYIGASESRNLRSLRRVQTYLTCPELLPNSRIDTPWQALYASQSDHAFITTMGLDVETFDVVIQSGFAQLWDTTPIPRPDAPSVAATRLTR